MLIAYTHIYLSNIKQKQCWRDSKAIEKSLELPTTKNEQNYNLTWIMSNTNDQTSITKTPCTRRIYTLDKTVRYNHTWR